jgi:phage repressor protein C with HTH and peptisase S24 domain
LKIVNAGALPKPTGEELVAIPFLRVVAAAGSAGGSSKQELSHARAEQMIAAPRLWCPNPGHTVCMRVKGNSMEPLLFDGYLIVVDQRQIDKKKLNGKMIVANRHIQHSWYCRR